MGIKGKMVIAAVILGMSYYYGILLNDSLKTSRKSWVDKELVKAPNNSTYFKELLAYEQKLEDEVMSVFHPLYLFSEGPEKPNFYDHINFNVANDDTSKTNQLENSVVE
jgi:hypothetical protein